MMNIVSNAIKFSKNNGKVEVKLHAKNLIRCKKANSDSFQDKKQKDCESISSGGTSQSVFMSRSFKSYVNRSSTLDNSKNDIYSLTFTIQIIDTGTGITESGTKTMFDEYNVLSEN